MIFRDCFVSLRIRAPRSNCIHIYHTIQKVCLAKQPFLFVNLAPLTQLKSTTPRARGILCGIGKYSLSEINVVFSLSAAAPALATQVTSASCRHLGRHLRHLWRRQNGRDYESPYPFWLKVKLLSQLYSSHVSLVLIASRRSYTSSQLTKCGGVLSINKSTNINQRSLWSKPPTT
jgi:hypothetical protein